MAMPAVRRRRGPASFLLFGAASALIACGEPTIDETATAVQSTRPAVSTTTSPEVNHLDRADARAVTVRVRAIGCGIGTGSGFLLGDRILVTNRHVVDGASQVQVGTWEGHNLDVEVSGMTRIADLGLVLLARPLPQAEFPGAARPIDRLGSEPLEPGDTVYAAGYPGGGPFKMTEGELVDEIQDPNLDGAFGVLRMTARVRPGNSGGPLLDSEGAVVGVVYAEEIATGYGLAVPIETLRQLLNDPDFLEPVEGGC